MCRLRPVAALLALLTAWCAAPAAEPVKVGDRAPDLSFTDIRYLKRSLDDFPGKKAYVLAFVTTGCPVVPRYMPALKRLDADYRDKGVQLLAVNVGPQDGVVETAAQAVEHDAGFPFVKDFGGRWAAALGVTHTPQVVVLDGERRLRYRGRIDDQYRPGVTRPAPTRNDLKEALDELLAGKAVSVPQTAADGCPITLPEPTRFDKPVTFGENVAPILRKHCADCHRPGTAAPFSLLTYEDARGRARAVASAVRDGRMPPWFADPRHGEFVNRRGLTAAERELVLSWAEHGTPEGDSSRLPAPPKPAPGWEIGEPDLVLTTGVFELPAEGDVPYKYAVLRHVFTEDTWVQGVQIRPDDRRLVHHANLAHVSLDQGFKAENFITGFVPGGDAMRLDDGTAFRIPKGSMLALQIHFVTTGKEEKSAVSVGLRFARGPVKRQLRHLLLVDTRFQIPPGASAHPVRASRVLDRDAEGVGLFAHMHLRGKAMTFLAHLPDGKTETLLVIPNYSFSWQIPYRWEPGKKRLPKGTRVECVALYDNSAFNPHNPDPKATVRDGPQTYHEMMNGFFFYLDDAEDLKLDIDGKTGHVREK
jgi:peroxiredoxin